MSEAKKETKIDPFQEAAQLGQQEAEVQAALRRRLPASQQEPPNLDDKLPCGFSRREIHQMKSAGMERPDMIPWVDWNGPKKLNHRHMLVCHLAALGYRNIDIARATNFGAQYICALLKMPEIQYQIQLVREVEMQGLGVMQSIDKMSSKAIRIYDDILNNPGAKLSLKQKTAQDILDRKLGKPQQRVEHSGSLIKEFYQTIKSIEDDRKKHAPLPAPQKVIEAETVEVSPAAEKATEVPKENSKIRIDTSKWIEETDL